jgi:hypothetical protein
MEIYRQSIIKKEEAAKENPGVPVLVSIYLSDNFTVIRNVPDTLEVGSQAKNLKLCFY